MAGGRDQLGPLERLTRLLLALESAEPVGLPAGQLVSIGEYGSTSDPHRLLSRDLTALTKIGWDIRNVSGPGVDAVYRLYARDTRLRVELAPEHQVELVRAALVAGDTRFRERLGDMPAPAGAGLVESHGPHRPEHDALDKAAYAAENGCVIRFAYKHRPRVVHPHVVHPGASGWYLVGHEDGSTSTKRFVTDRMSKVTLDPPGTADAVDDGTYDQLNPITWAIDSPVDVVVETTSEHEPQVAAMLGVASSRVEHSGVVQLTVTVTHRAAFRARAYELGRRVRVVSPAEVVDEIVAELRRFVLP